MRDLDIWRRLEGGVATADDLAALAMLPLGRRCAYIGPALRLTGDPDPARRAAALRVLAGARGVEGVRVLVAALDDEDAGVRTAALEALRETARDAPLRFAHALFHGSPEIRRAAADHDHSQPVAELVTYLRADPACADLAARHGRWPTDSLPLALGLHADGHLPAADLVAVVASRGGAALHEYLLHAHKRDPEVVSTYIDMVATRGLAATGAPPGTDVADGFFHAFAQVPPGRQRDGTLAELVAGGGRSYLRRIVASLLGQLARGGGDALLWATCVALEPRLLATPDLPLAHVDAIIDAMLEHRGAALPNPAIERLLALPIAKADLALSAAIVGRAQNKRLRLLADVRGEDAIIDQLVASDRGWREICSLPVETPAVELAWLQQIDRRDYKRYVALAGITVRRFAGTRQALFLEQLPRRHRPAVFLAALLGAAGASDERLLALCRVLAPRIDRVMLVALLPTLLDQDPSGRLAVGVVRYVQDNIVGGAARDLSVPHVVRLVERLDKDPAPRDRELALARTFQERGIAEVADWCRRVDAVLSTVAEATSPLIRARRALTPGEERAIQSATTVRALDTALAPALGGCVTGLVRALDRPHPEPHVWACVALLACADRFEDVARMLDLYSEPSAAFASKVEDSLGSMAHVPDLPPLAQARLWRWERQQFAFLDWMEAAGGALQVLQAADSMRRHFASATLWQAVSEGLMLLRYRNLPRFQQHATEELARYCADRVDTPSGRHAARIIVAAVEARLIPVTSVRDRVLDRVADADAETRRFVARLVRLEGVPVAEAAPALPPVNVVDEIRTSTDVEALATWCLDPRPAIVQEAALALVALGSAGQLRLAALLAAGGVRTPVPILATVVLWDHEPALATVRDLAARPDLEPSWQFHLALALLYRGEQDALPRALAAARSTTERWYFRREDWTALVKIADEVTCAIALADAPHHHAYQRAVNTLLSLTRPTPEVHDALVRFLEIGDERPLHLRTAAARYIARHWHDARGLPLLVEAACEPRTSLSYELFQDAPDSAAEMFIRSVVDAALIAGDPVVSETRMWWLVENARMMHRISKDLSDELRLRIFLNSSHAVTRRVAAQHAVSAGTGHANLRRVAEVFAWGVRRSVELTGRVLKFHLTSTEKDLGHTRLDGNRIFVSALPMLRNEPHGRDIVEGLVLHEIGHHVYHRGKDAQALWKRAHAEGIGYFLNLIADEHLERNLRAIDPAYGDRLKRLGAYAFHHAPQEIRLSALCESLRAALAPALIAADFEVAFDEAAVRVRRGAILGELDRVGHPVARFARSLRMGLGNRAGDPLNAAALALCGKELRALDMQGLYDLTRRLVDVFGGRVEIAKVFGGPEGLEFGERDDDVFGAGIDDGALQEEIERILEPGRSHAGPGPRSRLAINVNPDTHFEKITKVFRIQAPGDQEEHRKIAREVARHSTRLRGYLDELGLRWYPVGARTQGRALDRTRMRALVTRNDPRILIARTPVRKTDLFLGTLVDCSGSMQARNNIDRARRFAVLVAEAVRELPGVEARFFGFTDSVIYDAGDKRDCHVTALEADGGNNDAAALHHAANVALAAPQRAKVLLMISDGLPTECSVAALRNLVRHLTNRRGIVCAQVAVHPLEEICFPHHVLLDDEQLDVAIAKFGRMIAELARRSLAS